MKHTITTLPADGINRRDALLLTVLASAVSLAGCGGGGAGGASGGAALAGVSSGGTGSFAAGSISGFGSIIVGDIRFDDSKASSIVDIDDDNRDLRNQLKLGMVVRVKGKPKIGTTADADTIEVRSELLGPVDSIDAANKQLKVLGQTVNVTATTFFQDGLAGLASLSGNDVVEVHGFVDPVNNAITATRIERKVLANVKAFKLQGTVSALDANATAKTFRIGALVIGFATPIDLPSNLVLANGLLVRLQLAVTTAPGPRKALKIRLVDIGITDRDEAEVEGTITALTSTSRFSVNGLSVDASGAVVPGGLKVGDRVEIDGSLANGILMARQVKVESENDQLKFELYGTISGLVNTATVKTFVLRNVTVDFSQAAFSNGLASGLKDGVSLEVKGVASAANSSTITATRISFE